MTGIRPRRVFVDRGCRGHGVKGPEVFISGQRKGVTPALRRDIRHRAAIEPVIGHIEERRPSGALPAERNRGRHAPCGHVRLRTQPAHDPALDPQGCGREERGKAEALRPADGAARRLTLDAIRGRHRRSQPRCGEPRIRERC